MNNAMRGVLLSGLVLPGLGQVVQKSYKRGIALMLIVLAAVITILVKAVGKALVILEKVEFADGPIDLESIYAAARQAVTAADRLEGNAALLLIAAGWLAGVVDAYLTGKKMDLEMHSSEKPPGRST